MGTSIENKNQLKQELLLQAHKCGVPDHLINGLISYIVEGVPTGGCLRAILENNLMEAFSRADVSTAIGMQNICSFLYNHAPSGCFGDHEIVSTWIKNVSNRKGI